MTNEGTVKMTDGWNYSVPNGQSFSLPSVMPTYTFALHNNEGEVGKLDFSGPELKFTGDADASAKVFIDFIASTFVGRLKQERDRALEEAHAWMLQRHEAQKHRDNYMLVEANRFEKELLK